MLAICALIGCAPGSAEQTATTSETQSGYDRVSSGGESSGYVDPYVAAGPPLSFGTQASPAAPMPAPMPSAELDMVVAQAMAAAPVSDSDDELVSELASEPAPAQHAAPTSRAAPPPPKPAPPRANAAKSTPEANPERDTAAAREHGLALIYDARVFLAVFESQRTRDAAETLAREADGYLVDRNDARISFRVPTSKFHATLAAALKLGAVLHREVHVRDVTDEFRDLQVRLRNAEAVRDRLEQLLARADKIDQALEVEHELERVAGEIERIKGRLAVLQELTSFSTITIELRPRPVDHIDSRVRLPFPWLDELGLSGLLEL